MQISPCSFGDSSFSFPALCLGISGRCAFVFRFVLPCSLCRVWSATCLAVAREAGSSVRWGTEGAGLPRHMERGLAAKGLSHKAARSLLTTPDPPLRLENPFFPPLVSHHSAPVSSSALPLPCHSSFLFCGMISGLGGLCPASDHGSSCLKVCCEHLHR